jgi:CubicO group peptidase (beta-lactamase class C family)
VGTRRQFLVGTATATAALLVQRRSAAAERKAIQPPPSWFLARLPRLMEISGTPGLTSIVIQQGTIIWQLHEGVLKAGDAAEVGPETMWPAASLGKPVFAAAALTLASEGVFDLDRPLRDYVPDHAASDDRTKKVTARHVLSHSAGFPNWRGRPDQPLASEFEPGSRFSYSGEGYYYLQRVVEHITGLGAQQFVNQRVFDPLAMKSATYGWRADVPSRLVTGHDRGVTRPSRELPSQLFEYARAHEKSFDAFSYEDVRGAMAQIPGAPPPVPNAMVPNVAGSLLTTSADYAKFLCAVLDDSGRLLTVSKAMRQSMATPQVTLNSAMAWGLGWGIETGSGVLWHWGDNGNWKNFVLIQPRDKAALLVFTNGSHGMNVAERLVAAATGDDHVAFQWL